MAFKFPLFCENTISWFPANNISRDFPFLALKNTLLLIGEKSDPPILLISNAVGLSSTLDGRGALHKKDENRRVKLASDERRTYYMEIK